MPTVERFYNLYRPTEVVSWQTGPLINRDHTAEPPIGRPLSRVGIHLLDPDGAVVAPGRG